MAKKIQNTEAKKNTPNKKTFEERLEKLEKLGEEIRRNDIPLDDAIRAFEEGISLARALEKDLGKIESRIEILMNGNETSANNEEDTSPDDDSDEKPEIGLFDDEE